MKLLFRLLIVLLVTSCSTNTTKENITDCDTLLADPIAYIYLQPYGDFTQQEAIKLAPEITKGLNKVYGGDWTNIKVLPHKELPKKAYYKPRNRYLASELLKNINSDKEQSYIICLTHKDISCKIHGQTNYGIMGLTPLHSNKSVVSDYRTKDLVAVIVHEFGHWFYKAKHCNNPECIMCDYQKHKGKPFIYRLCKEHSFMN